MLYGVDVHARYQGGLDVGLLARQGYSFLVSKASEGTGIPSLNGSSSAFMARTLQWMNEARAAGMIPGLYHWIKSGNGGGQARFFYDIVKAMGGPAGMLIQLDCEDNATYQDVVAWAAEWNRLTGGHPFAIYTGGWWWRPRGWNGAVVTPHLWDSHYLTADADTIPDNPAQYTIPPSWWTPAYGNWPAATILQFTSRGDAGSLGNNIDLNAYRGTREQLLALTTGVQDMSTVDERNRATADAWRLLTILANRAVAEYQLEGEALPRREPNELKALLERVEQAVKAAPEFPVTAEEFEAMHERVMRRILGSVDGATPAV